MKKQFVLGTSMVALSLSTLLAGCGGKSGETTTPIPDNAAPAPAAPASSSGAVSLNGAGATFPYPIYSKWFDAYATKSGVKINYQSVGSGAGIKQIKAGTVDFGASDAPLSADDIKAMPSPVVQIPTVAGAVVLAYNLPGVTDLKLSGDLISGLFMGTIKKWSDPKIAAINPGVKLPDIPVTPAHRSDGSGTTNIFTTYLSAVSPEWKKSIGAGKSVTFPVGLGGKGSDGVASTVKGTAGGIGYVELAYALQGKMTFASVKNGAGEFVVASPDSTTAAADASSAAVAKDITAPIANAPGAKSYPIAAFTYLIVYKEAHDPAKGKALSDFLTWAMTDGQKEAAPLNYAALPTSVVALNEKTISSLK